MNSADPRNKGMLLLLIPVSGAILLGMMFGLSRRDSSAQRNPQNSGMQNPSQTSVLQNEGRRAITDPVASALENLRRVQQGALKGTSGPTETRAAKAEIIRLGDSALSKIRELVYSANEQALFRMELIALLGAMKTAAAQALLVEIFSDRNLEERFRATALAQLNGKNSPAFFDALRRVYSEEPDYQGRNLLLRAIGEIRDPDSTRILEEAAEKERGPSERIQALNSLQGRVNESGVFEAIRKTLYEDADETVRVAALAAFGRSPDPSVDKLLQEIADSPEMSQGLRTAARNWLNERHRK